MTRKGIAGVLVAAAVVVAFVVGLVRAVGEDGAVPQANPTGTALPSVSPGPTASAQPPASADPSADVDDELGEGDGYEEPPSPLPTNVVTPGGTDMHEDDEVPEAERAEILDRNTEFWDAFSIRDAGDRDTALAEVAAQYLAEKMSVPRTDRIPVVEPQQQAITAGAFNLAYVVTEDQTGQWWTVQYGWDPVQDVWLAHTYDLATPGQISDAQQELG